MSDEVWVKPFLTQAREDLCAVESLDPQKHAAIICSILQKVFEKLAKARLARDGDKKFERHVHKGAYTLVHSIKLMRDAKFQVDRDTELFVKDLEEAHPANVTYGREKFKRPQIPQLDYPWQVSISSPVCTPTDDLPVAQLVRRGDPAFGSAIALARQIADNFDVLFPAKT